MKFVSFVFLLGVVDLTSSLSCSDLELLSGGHPTVFDVKSATGNSPETSHIVWESTGEIDTSLTSSVTCTEQQDFLLIHSNGIPATNIGRFPMQTRTTGRPHFDNPNTIVAQNDQWRIPKTPKIKAQMPRSIIEDKSALPMGPIGFARNGVPFYNPFNNQDQDAVSRQSDGYEVMDLCYGHPDERGRYHHHHQQAMNGCLFGENGALINVTDGQRSPKLGYAFDGIPIYGPIGEGGKVPTDLDVCNGRHDSELDQYVYHITELRAPYIIGCYRYEYYDEPRPGPPSSIDEAENLVNGGLSKGAVAAIVAACLLVLVALSVGFWYYRKRTTLIRRYRLVTLEMANEGDY